MPGGVVGATRPPTISLRLGSLGEAVRGRFQATAWRCWQVLEARGLADEASDAFLTALELEQCTPVRPFSCLRLEL